MAKLKAALATAGAKPEGAAGEGASMADTAVAAVMAKFGISAETTGLITGLLDNPAVKGVLGATLTQLKGLIPAM